MLFAAEKSILARVVNPVTEWSLERKLEHAENMALKLMDKYPLLADLWLTSADLIQSRIKQNNTNSQAITKCKY